MARPELVAVSGCTFRCHAVGLPLSYVVPSKVIEPLPRDEAAAASASRNEEGRFKDDLERPERKHEAEKVVKLYKTDPPRWLETVKAKWRVTRAQRVQKLLADNPDYAVKYLVDPSTDPALRGPKKPRAPPGDKPPRKQGPRGVRGAVSLKQLIDAGIIKAGAHRLFISYMSNDYRAELRPDGTILWEGRPFNSPSAWSIFVKRQTNPEKKADDGWKSVKYGELNGSTLESLKHRFEESKRGPGEDGEEGGGGGEEGGEGGDAAGRRKRQGRSEDADDVELSDQETEPSGSYQSGHSDEEEDDAAGGGGGGGSDGEDVDLMEDEAHFARERKVKQRREAENGGGGAAAVPKVKLKITGGGVKVRHEAAGGWGNAASAAAAQDGLAPMAADR